MNITLIGTGNVGTGLASAFAAAGCDVALGGRSADTARDVARTVADRHGTPVHGGDIAAALSRSDLVVLAVPYGAVDELAATHDFAGKTVVDATNPLTDDFPALTIGHDTSGAERIQARLPDASVVKGFNTVFAQIYARGLRFGDRAVPVFLATDDESARRRVAETARHAGFEPVDAGPLSNARHLEPLAALNIQLGYALGRGTQIVPAWLER